MKRLIVFVAAIAALGVSSCSNPPTVDDRAHELIDRLGPMCDNMDFQLKASVGEGEVRPVTCSRVSEPDDPQFTLFVFSSSEAQERWLQLPGSMEARYHVNSEGWSAMSDQQAILDDVEDRLTDG
jgi:hypothetical protein